VFRPVPVEEDKCRKSDSGGYTQKINHGGVGKLGWRELKEGLLVFRRDKHGGVGAEIVEHPDNRITTLI